MADEQDVPWLDQDELRAWISLAVLLEVLPTAIDTQLKRDSGLNSFEYQIMAGLSDSPGRAIRMSQLALFAAGSLSRLSHAVDRLERQGLVERRQCPADSRATEAVLTEAGVAKMVAAAPAHVREARRLVVDPLTPEQLAQLADIARGIIGRVSPETLAVLDAAPALQRGSGSDGDAAAP